MSFAAFFFLEQKRLEDLESFGIYQMVDIYI